MDAIKFSRNGFLKGTAMAMKDDVIRALKTLPDDASVDEIADRVYLVLMVERRLEEADEGRLISDSEARDRLKTWLE